MGTWKHALTHGNNPGTVKKYVVSFIPMSLCPCKRAPVPTARRLVRAQRSRTHWKKFGWDSHIRYSLDKVWWGTSAAVAIDRSLGPTDPVGI